MIRAEVKTYCAFRCGDSYIILDKDHKEIGKMRVGESELIVELDYQEEQKFESKEFEKWITEHGYMLTKVSPRFVEFNPNPSKNVKANDCTIRAYCAAENLSWEAAYDIACQHGKSCTYMPNDKAAMKDIIENEFGYTYNRITKAEKGITIQEFAIKYNVGTYLVMVPRHLVAVVDGKYYDTWDSGSKKISGYFSKD